MNRLLADIRACRECALNLPHGPRPVIQAHPMARLLIIGQAPGAKVHESGIPWMDASGRQLREWLGIDDETFYDAKQARRASECVHFVMRSRHALAGVSGLYWDIFICRSS